MPNALEVVLDFNEHINARDLDALAAMMTDDHVFIDTAGHRVIGKPACVEAWRGFFNAFPDYHNLFDHVGLRPGDEAVVRGESHCSDARLAGPALWSAKARNGKLKEWRVWSDTPANRKRLGLN